MRAIRLTAAATAILVYALIVLGAVVRTTNSGLSCPDWPTCYGHWLPLPADIAALPSVGYSYGQVMLEWVHRLIAGVFVGPLVLVVALLAFRYRHDAPRIALSGGLLVLLLLVQGALGGLTVLDQNSPWSVAIHLGNALLVLTMTLRIAILASPPAPTASARFLCRSAVVAWVLALLAMMSAAMAAKSGASLACTTWPLCEGALVPDLGDELVRLHFLHRVLAAVTACAVMVLFWRSRTSAGLSHGLARLVALATVLVLVQVALGAMVILLEAPVWNAVLHQAVGVLTFAVVTVILWRCAAAGGASTVGERDGLALRGA